MNGNIHILCKILDVLCGSAAEAKLGGIHLNAQTAITMRRTLKNIGHPQPPTPIRTDNSASTGFVNKNMQMKMSKTWDMQLHWLRDKENQIFFKVFWDKGQNKGADYFTKHHPTVHHRRVRQERNYVRDLGDNFQAKISHIFSSLVIDMPARVC